MPLLPARSTFGGQGGRGRWRWQANERQSARRLKQKTTRLIVPAFSNFDPGFPLSSDSGKCAPSGSEPSTNAHVELLRLMRILFLDGGHICVVRFCEYIALCVIFSNGIATARGATARVSSRMRGDNGAIPVRASPRCDRSDKGVGTARDFNLNWRAEQRVGASPKILLRGPLAVTATRSSLKATRSPPGS